MKRPLNWFAGAVLLLAPALLWAANDRAEAQAALKYGLAYERAGNLQAASAELARAVAADPGWPDARMALARIMLALGNGLGAEAEVRQARDLGLSADATRVAMAHAALLQGEPARALTELRDGPIPDRNRAYAARIAGNAHLELGQFNPSRDAFDEAIRLDRNNSQLWADIARFRHANADIGGAAGAIDLALQLNRDNMDAVLVKAMLVREKDGLLPSLGWYERVIKAKPDHIDALIEYAATLGDAGRYHDMLRITRRVLALNAGNARALLLQATLAARAEHYDLAQRILFRIGDPLHDLPAFLLVSAVVEEELGNHNLAASHASRLLDQQPDNFTARRLLALSSLNAGDADDAWRAVLPVQSRPDAGSWPIMLAAAAAADQARPPEEIALLTRASRFRQGDAGAISPTADPVLLAADAARNPLNARAVIPYIRLELDAGRAVTALGAAQRLQQASPGVPDAHILVGDTERAARRPVQAAAAYRRAAGLRFGEAAALRLADSWSRLGDDAAALATLGQFIVRNPENVPATRILASLYLQRGDWDRAIAALEMVRARTGNRDALLMNELGRAWLAAGDAERASTYFRHAYAIQPANAAITANLGWSLSRLDGHHRASIELLEKAVALAPDNGDYRRKLTRARADQNISNSGGDS